jgi:hypothetical protein
MSEYAGFVSGGCRKDVKHFNQTSITMNPYNGIRRLVVTALLISNLASAQSPPISAVAPVPAFHKGVCILFQGDSITDGNRGRSMDPNHILGHGYAFIIAARYGAAFPERNLTFLNRGRAMPEGHSSTPISAKEACRFSKARTAWMRR